MGGGHGASSPSRRGMAGIRCERGQATIEWVGLVLIAALVLGALAASTALQAGPLIDGRPFGGFLAHRIACAVTGRCEDGGDAALARASGEDDAALLREHAPNIVYEPGELQLPIDYRECRSAACAEAPDDRDLDLDVHAGDAGARSTAFTRILRRDGRTYLQYCLHYPDSNSTLGSVDRLWNAAPLGRWPGYHPDDWESFQVRIDADGRKTVRASSHGHYQWCKQAQCRNEWGPSTGWTRVSRGSHAGHVPLERDPGPRRGRVGTPRPASRPVRFVALIPGLNLRERTTTAEGLRLVGLETLDKRTYRPIDPDFKPAWKKEVYGDPESDGA